VLMGLVDSDPEAQSRVAAFEHGLRELGWVKGRNLWIEYRWAGGGENILRNHAAELLALAPDLILANSTPVTAALQEQSQVVPIVFTQVTDPVGQGLVPNLAHPGGNITGFTFVEYAMFGKSLDLLRQAAPAARRVAFLFNPDTSPYYDRFLPQFETEARAHSVDVTHARVRNESEVDAAVRELAARPGGGLMVPPDTYTLANRGLIVKSAAQYRVPAIFSYRQSVKEGGLMSYAPETADIFRRSASYVDRILKGANPGELPAQAPTKFEFAVNLKTAAALGLPIPPTLLALADEVIE
jgi:putative tryptophan/tyrosine transport system substrate-binding protein